MHFSSLQDCLPLADLCSKQLKLTFSGFETFGLQELSGDYKHKGQEGLSAAVCAAQSNRCC
jgi:hypothetical protein